MTERGDERSDVELLVAIGERGPGALSRALSAARAVADGCGCAPLRTTPTSSTRRVQDTFLAVWRKPGVLRGTG